LNLPTPSPHLPLPSTQMSRNCTCDYGSRCSNAKCWSSEQSLVPSLKAIRMLKDFVDFLEEAFDPETANAFKLGIKHALYVRKLFLPKGCWTGNLSTSILEAKAKGIINEEAVDYLVRFNAAVNKQARHPGPAKSPAPDLLKTDQEWRRSPEFNQYFAGGAARITEL
jgi:hypothetical protein